MVYVDRNDVVNFLFSFLSDKHEEFMEISCRGMIYYSFKLQKRIFNPLVLRENCSKGKGLIPVNTLLAHHHYFLSFFFFLFFFLPSRLCITTKSSKSTTVLEKNLLHENQRSNDCLVAHSVNNGILRLFHGISLYH